MDEQEYAVFVSFFQNDSAILAVYSDADGRNKIRTDRNGKRGG